MLTLDHSGQENFQERTESLSEPPNKNRFDKGISTKDMGAEMDIEFSRSMSYRL